MYCKQLFRQKENNKILIFDILVEKCFFVRFIEINSHGNSRVGYEISVRPMRQNPL